MLTVVICDKEIIGDIHEKYGEYFSSFFENDNLVFCEWNVRGTTLDDAVPALRSVINKKREWRVVVINSEKTFGNDKYIRKPNPFDYVGYKAVPKDLASQEEIIAYRDYLDGAILKAFENPLTKLGFWLFGSPVKEESIGKDIKKLVDVLPGSTEYFDFLEGQNISAHDVEMSFGFYTKYQKIIEKFDVESEVFYPPTTFLAIAERSFDMEVYNLDCVWKDRTEYEYSEFYRDNLYYTGMKYAVFDIPRTKGVREESKYLDFLSAILIIASNEIPTGTMRSGRVFRLNVNVDLKTLGATVNRYTDKLLATIGEIEKKSKYLDDVKAKPISNDNVQRDFEANTIVPVELFENEDRKEFFVKYNELGLSVDCPSDEYGYWEGQYTSILKKFTRFLRKPRRAVKNAVDTSFRNNNFIDDERIDQLNEFQIEDIRYSLDEEEFKMITTTTSQLFNTQRYNDEIKKTDHEVKHKIAQRMTKKKTVVISLVAFVAYLLGFIPLLFSSNNKAGSFSVALIFASVFLGLFLLIAFVCLFYLRNILVNRFKHFNYVMSGVLGEIEASTQRFSKYLSHACNVMRKFSILNSIDDAYCDKQSALLYHKETIYVKIEKTRNIFSAYVESDVPVVRDDILPYQYDFTKFTNYYYEIPFCEGGRQIDFIQPGNRILIPIDYVESITVTREELYD